MPRPTSARSPKRRRPPSTGGPSRRAPKPELNAPPTYATLSTRPLHVLLFLLPLVLFYEISTAIHLRDAGIVDTIAAHHLLWRFFSIFGSASLYIPGVALLATLIAWHVMSKDPVRVRPSVLLGMTLEAALWTLPLLVLALVIGSIGTTPGAESTSIPPPAAALLRESTTVATLRTLPWTQGVTIALGAGIYEELLFRLLLITGVHFLAVDLARLSDSTGNVIAVIVSALAFAFYHEVFVGGGGGGGVVVGWGAVDMRMLTFYTLAGLYFGSIFLVRGFGVVVAVHALYDVVTIVLLTRQNP